MRTSTVLAAMCAALLVSAGLRSALSSATTDSPLPDAALAQPPELVVQTGHSAEVSAVAFSSDGSLLASGSNDNTIKLWRVATGRELRALVGHAGDVVTLAFSPDGRWLASGAHDTTVRLWDVPSGRLVHTLAGHRHWVKSVAFSPDGRSLASASRDGTVRQWDVSAGREVRALVGHNEKVWSVVFDPHGRWLASGGGDARVRIWDVASGRQIRTLSGHSTAIYVLGVSRDGRSLASASDDGTTRLWDVDSGRALRTLTSRSVVALTFSPDDRSLAAAEEGGTARLWDVSTGSESPARRWQGGVAAFTRDMRSVAWGETTGAVVVGELTSGSSRHSLAGYVSGVNTGTVSADGRWLAVGSDSGVISVWEIAAGRPQHAIRAGTSITSPIVFARDSRWLAATAGDEVRLWDPTSGQPTRTLRGGQGILALAASPDARLLATGGTDKKIVLWDIDTGGQVRTLLGHQDRVEALAFSPDGRSLASGGADQKIRLWDVATGRELRSVLAHRIQSVRFSPDGRWVATAEWAGRIDIFAALSGRFGPAGGRDVLTDWAGKVRLIDFATGREVRSLQASRELKVTDVAYSPDGRRLIAGTEDHAMKVWDADTGRDLWEVRGHSRDVTAVASSRDGRVYFSTARDGSTRVWDAQTGAHLATLLTSADGRDWMVTTPEGLFDGSPSAWQRIAWRFDPARLDTVPVELFFNEFYYPGLLTDLAAGKRPRAPRAISRVDRRQPSVQLTLAETTRAAVVGARTVKVKVEVAEAPADATRPDGSGVRDVRLFRNGSLVKIWRGNVLGGSERRAVLETPVTMSAGPNRLTAYAFNRDNVKSTDASVEVTGGPALRRGATAYILVVGIDKYSNRDYNLRYAVADARAFADELRRQQQELGAYARVEIITLLDEYATKRNVLGALNRLAGTESGPAPPGAPVSVGTLGQAQPEDSVFMYFAGHGTAEGPRFYLLPHDLGYTGRRTELNDAGLRTMLAHGISDVELEAAFESVGAGRLVLIIDACNSGQALEAEEKRRGPMNSKGLAQLAYEKGMHVLTAAQGYQAALEAEQLGHGLLTYSLVEEGLRAGAADRAPRDGQITVGEWFDYSIFRVPRLQQSVMREARARGRDLAFVEDQHATAALDDRDLQHPRAFSRRELDLDPLVVARVRAPDR